MMFKKMIPITLSACMALMTLPSLAEETPAIPEVETPAVVEEAQTPDASNENESAVDPEASVSLNRLLRGGVISEETAEKIRAYYAESETAAEESDGQSERSQSETRPENRGNGMRKGESSRSVSGHRGGHSSGNSGRNSQPGMPGMGGQPQMPGMGGQPQMPETNTPDEAAPDAPSEDAAQGEAGEQPEADADAAPQDGDQAESAADAAEAGDAAQQDGDKAQASRGQRGGSVKLNAEKVEALLAESVLTQEEADAILAALAGETADAAPEAVIDTSETEAF